MRGLSTGFPGSTVQAGVTEMRIASRENAVDIRSTPCRPLSLPEHVFHEAIAASPAFHTFLVDG